MNQADQHNYYEILEVAIDASTTDIHKAYTRARSTYSQDNPALYSMFSPEEARELLAMIEEAYAVLSNQMTRKSYDQSLLAPGAATSAFTVDSKPQAAKPMAAESHASEGEPKLKKKSAAAATKPAVNDNDGSGRTPLSTYRVDDGFESEIASASKFDGAFLQKIRSYKNITIDRMSEVTRVSRTYLAAVEANDYKSLPAAVFVRGFVVQIARNLGLDENKVATSYMQIFKAGGGK